MVVGSCCAALPIQRRLTGRPRVFRTAVWWAFSCCELPVQVLVVDLLRGLVAEC